MQLGAFPIDSEAMNKFKGLYEVGRGLAYAFLPVLVMIRALLNLFFLKSSSEYFEIIKDLILAAVLLGCFMQLLEGIISIPTFYADLLRDYATYELKIGDQNVIDSFTYFAWFMIVCYWISYVIYFMALALFAAFGAYLIVAGTMFQSYWVLKASFWLLVILSSWPLIWYTINIFIGVLTKDQNGITSTLITVILTGVKLLVPIIAFLKVWTSSAVQTAASGTKLLQKSTAFGFNQASNILPKLGSMVLGSENYSNIKDKVSQASSMSSSLAGAVPKVISNEFNSSLGRAGTTIATHLVPNAISKLSANIGSNFKDKVDPYTQQKIPLSSNAALKFKKLNPKLYSEARNSLISKLPIEEARPKPFLKPFKMEPPKPKPRLTYDEKSMKLQKNVAENLNTSSGNTAFKENYPKHRFVKSFEQQNEVLLSKTIDKKQIINGNSNPNA